MKEFQGEKTEGGTLKTLMTPEIVSANELLERPGEEKYLAEWTALVQEPREVVEQREDTSLMVFRLGREWLGMSTVTFIEVFESRPIHKIPHRTNPILMGVTNFRGQLKLCGNLQQLLELDPEEKQREKKGPLFYQRMLAAQKEEDFWIFPVDEVWGIFRFELSAMQNVPVTISKSSANYIKGVLSYSDMTIGVLDEELLFYSLKRCLL